MGTITANGFDAISGRINEPLNGGWTAELQVDIDEDRLEVPPAVGAPITIIFEDGPVTFVGTVDRGAFEAGRWLAKVVGGMGGLRKETDCRHYVAATAGVVLTDMLAPALEVFDPVNSDTSVAPYVLARWTRVKGEVRFALGQIARELTAHWRITREGQVILKQQELFLPVVVEFDEIDRDTDRGILTIAPEAPLVEPGTSLLTDKASEVVTEWDGRGGIRQILTLEDPDERPRGSAVQLVNAMKRVNEQAIDYSRMWPSRVVAQNPTTLELEILPDNAKLRGTGMQRIPIRHGLPGVKVKVAPGAKVNLFFEDGDPKKPAVALWPDNQSAIEIVIDATLMKVGSATASVEKMTKAESLELNLVTAFAQASLLALPTDGGRFALSQLALILQGLTPGIPAQKLSLQAGALKGRIE